MATHGVNVLPYLAAIRKVIQAMPMAAAEREAVLQGLERFCVHASNQKQYARLKPFTPEQRARKAAATKRWRARKLAAAEAAAAATLASAA